MTPEPLTTKPPTLGAQVSRAVLWNVLFVPLRMISEIVATLIKLTVLAPISAQPDCWMNASSRC